MVNTSARSTTDIWVTASWNEYLQNIEKAIDNKTKSYYYNGKYRIEMTPIGNEHSQDHFIINYAIYLYATLKSIKLNGKDNCSYRQPGKLEIQPDLSCYVGENANAIPWGTGIVDFESISRTRFSNRSF